MKAVTALFTGLVCVAACAQGFGQSSGTQILPDRDDYLSVTPRQIKEAEIKALDGSPQAADELGMYYVVRAMDDEKALQWYQIAAENGSVDAMWNYYVLTSEMTDPNLVRRGRFWLKRAASMHHTLAVAAEAELEKGANVKP